MDSSSSGPATAREQNPAARAAVSRNFGIQLLVTIALLFVLTPLLDELQRGDLIGAALLTLVMLTALLAVGGQRRTLTVALLLVGPALAAKWIHHFWPERISQVIALTASMAFFGFVIVHLLRFVLRTPRADANVLCAGLSGYLLLGLLWMPAYVLVSLLDPGAFAMTAVRDPGAAMSGFDAFYFSFITLCTVGYGDVVPVSRAARMLAVTESITGLFYVAVFISRLVAMHSARRSTGDGDAPSAS